MEPQDEVTILYTMGLSPVICEYMYRQDVIMTKPKFWFVRIRNLQYGSFQTLQDKLYGDPRVSALHYGLLWHCVVYLAIESAVGYYQFLHTIISNYQDAFLRYSPTLGRVSSSGYTGARPIRLRFFPR
jgi:hypothetical protein